MAIYRDGELWLYGIVGDSYWDEGFTASEVLAALAEHGRENDLTVHINSPGGRVDDGVAIYNALATHTGAIRIEIDAVAMSSASLIAMAGETIVMRAGSVMMIHDPATGTWGTAADHAKSVEQLEAFAKQMASIYADRSNKTAEEARAEMKGELWMTAAEAVDAGYADEAEATKAVAVAAFDYRVFAKAPRALKSAARVKGWKLGEDGRPAAEAQHHVSTTKEAPMAETTTDAIATAVQASKDRRKAIMALEETAGREDLAAYFADDTDDTVEKVKAVLARSPKGGAQPETPDAGEYEASRTQAAGAVLQGGKPPSAKGDKSVLAAAVARTNAQRKR